MTLRLFLFCSAFLIQRFSCLTSDLCVYMPLRAEGIVCVTEAYVEVCLILCDLDRVRDIQG